MGKLSDFNLQKYVSQGYKTFVESGTGRGDGLKYAATHSFQKLYSTEIVEELFKSLVPHFSHDQRIQLFGLHAPEFLEKLFNNFIKEDEPIVYFSDAHYPAADVYGVSFEAEKDMDKRLPLQRELEVFKDYGRTKDVIIIDDLRIYKQCPAPVQNLDKIGLGSIASYNNAFFVYDLFDKTHNIQEIYQDTGYILLTPKL